MPVIPIDAATAQVASALFVVCCITGFVGLFSRASAFGAFVLGAYVLGITQFYGKVDHYHHFVWFAAILAVSRSGDVLSIDAVVVAWKKGKYAGTVEVPGRSRIYALPLRFVWLLLGVIYLFPGLWKVWAGGWEWAFSDNMKYHLYSKWFELGGWTPFFRIDQYPLLYQFGAVATIVFEVGFIGLIFFRKLRPLAVGGGIAFHEMTNAFMRITFRELSIFYSTFIDWAAILRYAGKKMFKQPMFVVYDGNCALCKRTIGTIRAFDVFGRVVHVNALNPIDLANNGLDGLDSDELLKDMHVVVGDKVFKGFYSYRALAWRMPFLWLALPFLWLWPVAIAGERIYRRVADHRACEIPSSNSGTPSAVKGMKEIWIMGSFLVLINIAFGVRGYISAWPFACYPTFSWIQGTEQQELEVVIVNSDGVETRANLQAVTEKFGPTKFWYLVRQILWWSKDDIQKKERLQALWHVVASVSPEYQAYRRVGFYETTFSILPEQHGQGALRKDLIHEMQIAAIGRQ